MLVFLLAGAALAQDPPVEPPAEPKAEPQAEPQAEPSAEPPIAEAPAPAPRLTTRIQSGEVNVFSEPSRDAFGMGQSVRLEAAAEDNVFLMGQHVTVGAPVGGDVFAMGQSLTIDAAVSGDVYAAGQHVTVTENGSIGGDLLGAGESIVVEGPIDGDVQVGASSLTVSAPVRGLVEATTGAIAFGPDASIGGDLSYSAPEEIAIPEGVVGGDVEFTRMEESDFESYEPSFAESAGWFAAWRTYTYAVLFAVGAVLFAIGGAAAQRASRAVNERLGPSFGWGFVVSSVLFAGSCTLMVMILPIPLGLLGLVVYGLLMAVAQVFTAEALGARIISRMNPEATPSPYAALALGLVPIVVLTSIPWLGTLVWAAATWIGVGALWLSSRHPEDVRANRATPTVA